MSNPKMLSLPNEILVQIIKYLDTQQDISSVCRVNCRFYWLFNRYLCQFNVFFRDGDAIIWAAEHGDEATALKFLQLGVPVDTTFLKSRFSVQWISPESYLGITPLQMASIKGHLSLVKLFLNKGANPDARFRNEWTPLYLALISKNEKVSRTISWYVSDIATHLVYASKRLSPLHLASYLGLATSVRFFLSKGIDINVSDSLENTPLHHALVSGFGQLGYNPKANTLSQTLQVASHDQVLETVVALIEAGADIDKEGFASQTPKKLAFNHEDERVRKLFGFIPKQNVPSSPTLQLVQNVSPRPKLQLVHIGRSWMPSNQHFLGEQEPRSSDPFHCGYQLQIFKVPGLAQREEVIRKCMPESNASGGQNNSKDIEATGLDDFPILGRMCESASLNGLDPLKEATWSRSKTNAVIANLVKTESEGPSSVSSAQHHEQVESFPQLTHNSLENPLSLTAKNMWKEFRETDTPRASTTEAVNTVNTATGLAAQKGRKAKGKSRWQPLSL